ncbi:MAG: ABC transporter ATP-binding protein [Thermacetogeniaceae bacterium]|jgi:branched-chain amino acid transport system ATP-binding protein
MLEVSSLHVHYGGIHALQGVSIEVKEGQIVAVVGANGAGKSTLLKTIAGAKAPTSGSITFEGKPLAYTPCRVVRQGIMLVPEGRQIFANLTVRENLLIGGYTRKNDLGDTLKEVLEVFPTLKTRLNQMGGTLSGGEQQMLAVGRAMMASPKLLLLDEPSLGLAPIIVDTLFATLKRIQSMGTTIVVVEQNAVAALELCDRAYVMRTGKVWLEGSGKELLADPRTLREYLGA